MQALTLESEVRRCLLLVGIRSIKLIRISHAETLFEGIAENGTGDRENVRIRVAPRQGGGSLVTIEGADGFLIEQASFASARDALLKAAVQWEARHLHSAEMTETVLLDGDASR